SRRSTGRSLMPEGFEALGGEGLRDVLAYICADENRFRIIDLGGVFTANTSRGIFNSEESREESLRFRKYGTIKVGDIPFDIISPQKSMTGNNVIVLKGGNGLARTFPQKVEVKVGMAANKLHFLGGVGGWAWPYDGERNKDLPVVKITVHYAGGATEEMVLKNGVEFADYIAKNDVPGSVEVPDLCQNGRQVRWFSRPLKNRAVVESLTLESYNNIVAPVFIGITAQIGEDSKTAAAAPAPALFEVGGKAGDVKVVITGGGSSHDFGRWWGGEDVATINGFDGYHATYTENIDNLVEGLKKADVLYLTHNKATSQDARAAVFSFVEAGKGLVVGHAGGWYNWADWPEFNKQLIGGGTRGHDKFEEFEVTVTDPNHPVMKGVPATFAITDELYNYQHKDDGAPITVLATAKSPITGKVFPIVWIVQNPKARIVCVTLGHDGKAHQLDAYKTILKNSLQWAARR
ncbi:MAG TPA: ThuA domain-containing protein, partial [Verrucomicrobiae bacterium]|nr:ThuA domain-containing protein [Verrucomicrobiae bacterium]